MNNLIILFFLGAYFMLIAQYKFKVLESTQNDQELKK
jgi:hypothetical protein